MVINRNSPIPIYYQLADQIREQIESGHLKPGSQLPSERELSERFKVSRMTTRQAITYLSRQGRLIIKPGIGTFVADAKLTHDTLHLLGFTEEMLRHGQAAASQVLDQVVVSPPKLIAARLSLKPGDMAIKIARLRLSQDTPLLLETVYIPQALAPGLENEDLSKASLYALLEQQFGVQLHHAQQTLEATTATEGEARLLEVAPGTTMLLLEGTTYTADEQPVEAFQALYRGDKFKFALESQRFSGGAGLGLPRLSVVLRKNH